MTKGTGTYDDPIIVDGIFTKTIDGVKKFFKLNVGSSNSSDTNSSNCVQYDSSGAITLPYKPQLIRKKTDDSHITLCGGNSDIEGGFVILHGSKEKVKPSCVELISQQGTESVSLIMWSSQHSLPYIEIKNGSTTKQKGIVFSVNNKIATNGNVDVYPNTNTGASPTGMLQSQTVASKKITQPGVIYVNITSAKANATVNLFVNSFKVFGFQPEESITNFKMFSAIVGKNDTVQFSYSNCTASWDFRPFI
jgi:hypothetical protein